jgi:DNA-binding PadR family transcriptional regulator
MPRIDWLLLLLRTADSPTGPLDPIRIQKALFYVSRDPNVPEHEKYVFEPYNYGPYSKQIYLDLDDLVARGLVEPILDASRRWSRYALTLAGAGHAAELRGQMSPSWSQLVDAARELVTSLSFQELLRKVYREHPAFAVNSIANV